jgi:hypothetical protein
MEAGFVATIVVSLLLLVQQLSGLAPEFAFITWVNFAAGTEMQPALGWVVHFIIGTFLWGVGFAAFSPHMWGPHWLRGVAFGVITWLLMMVAFLPAAGVPMFGLDMGLSTAILGLVISLVFGVVLGETYHLLLHYLPSEVDENA